MKIDDDLGAHNAQRIMSYDIGRVVVAGVTYHRSLLVSPQHGVQEWAPGTFAELLPAHFNTIADLDPEIVLLGTGDTLKFPPPPVLQPLTYRSIGLEVMDTGAACRAYNVLLGEGRRVVAALLMID